MDTTNVSQSQFYTAYHNRQKQTDTWRLLQKAYCLLVCIMQTYGRIIYTKKQKTEKNRINKRIKNSGNMQHRKKHDFK